LLNTFPRSTRLGWFLLLALSALALLPIAHWARSLTMTALMMGLFVFIWYICRPDHIAKTIRLRIEGVEPADHQRFLKALDDAFGPKLTPIASVPASGELAFRLKTELSLSDLRRQLRALNLPMGLLTLEGEMYFTTTTAQAKMEVEVKGVATPNAQVFLPGVPQTIEADRRGRFQARVPFAIVQKYAARGYLTGMWRKQSVEGKVRVPIPS
jgi:hypothetical protein